MAGQTRNEAVSPAPASELEEAVRKRNASLDEYLDRRFDVQEIAKEIRQLLGPSPEGIEKTLMTMSDIESLLDANEELLVELGHLPEHGGDFDIVYYQWMRLERRIADGKIEALSDVPKEFHADFSYLFDHFYDGRWPRNSEAICDDLDVNLEELDYEVRSRYDFSNFMPQGRTKRSPKLDALRAQLNQSWDEFKLAARAVAYHF